ncbi:FKBP-type peptidyl-prolyl cis-trans isomerase [Aquimarina brevivitae]|nr:hypothetical protein [Aquimarina brevivitae]
MKFVTYLLLAIAICTVVYSCRKDDDNEVVAVPVRDRGEQQIVDDALLQDYLRTHFYTLQDIDLNNDDIAEYQVPIFDTIAGDNSGQQSIWDSGLLETKSITRNDVNYTLYILKFNEGAGISERKSSPVFTDSTYVTYRGEILYDNVDADGDGIPDVADVDADGDGVADVIDEEVRTDRDGDGIADDSDADDDGTPGTDPGKEDSDGDGIIDEKDPVDNTDLDRRVFDSAVTPVWFNLVSVIEGFREATVDFKVSSGLESPPPADGTVDYIDDFGDFTVFIPSGLAYYVNPPLGSGIPLYSSLVFNVQLYELNEADHDRDGIPSYLEDLDGDRLVIDEDDDTDNNGFSNYIDADDDGDGTPTKDEITELGDLNNDGSISLDELVFYDDDGDGVPNHLDPDDDEFKND